MNCFRRMLWLFCLGIILCMTVYPYGNHGQLTDKGLRAKKKIYESQGATEWLKDLDFYRGRIIQGSIDEDHLWEKKIEQMSSAEKRAFIDSWLSSMPPLAQAFYRGLISTLGLDKAAAKIADGLSTSSHFWDPYTGEGLTSENALEKGTDLYNQAVDEYLQGDKDAAFYTFGRAMHYLQDMGVPAHVKNLIHVWQSLTDTGYESYVADNWGNKDWNNGQSINDSFNEDDIISEIGSLPFKDFSSLMEDLAEESYQYPADGIFISFPDILIVTLDDKTDFNIVSEGKLPLYVCAYSAALENKFKNDVENKKTSGTSSSGPGSDYPDDNESSAALQFSTTERDPFRFYRNFSRLGVKKDILGAFVQNKTRNLYAGVRLAAQAAFESRNEKIYTDGIKLFYDYKKSSNENALVPAYEDAIKFGPDIAILKRGYYKQTIRLIWDKWQEPIRLIDADFSASELAHQRILVIPTGGFYGLEKSEQFKASLRNYVQNGGTVFVFSQQHGYEYSVLPRDDGEAVEGYGWREDQSCWVKSVYVDSWHPALYSIANMDVTVPVDGYLSNYPQNAVILLRRTRNAEPSLAMWRIGGGQVIASSLFTDSHYGGTIESERIVRDILSYAKNPSVQVPEYNLRLNASPEVSLNLELKNISNAEAAKARVLWLDPNRSVIFEEEKAVSIQAGENISLAVNHAFSGITINRLGIWQLNYILYDFAGNEIQPQAEINNGVFALTRPPEGIFKPDDLTANITSPDEKIITGSEATFQVHISNQSENDKKLHLWWKLYDGEDHYWKEVTVPANGTWTDEIKPSLRTEFERKFLILHIYEENGNGQYNSMWRMQPKNIEESWLYVGSVGRRLTLFRPLLGAGLEFDKKVYKRGEEIKPSFYINNLIDRREYQLEYDFYIMGWDVNGIYRKLISDQGPLVIEPLAEIKLQKNYSLSANATFYPYEGFFSIRIKNNNFLGWGDRKNFNIRNSQVSEVLNVPLTLIYGQDAHIESILRCGNYFPVDHGILNLRLISAMGESLFQETKSASLTIGETKTIDFTVPMTSLKLGTNRLEYSYSDETGCQFAGMKPIEYKLYSPSATTDKNFYQIGDTARLQFKWAGYGKVETYIGIEVSMPETGFKQTSQAHYIPGSTGGTLDVDIPIPASLLSSRPELVVTYILPSGERDSQKLNLNVTQPYITLNSRCNKSFYRVRENITLNFEVEGNGGFLIPLPSQLRVEIPSLNYDVTHPVTVIPGGKSEVPITLPIPESLAAGPYDVKFTMILPSGGGSVGQSLFTIMPPAWNTSLDKNTYQVGESIGITITNSGGVDGTVDYRFVLKDNLGGEIALKEGQSAVRAAGETKETLPIPSQAANGEYQLYTTVTEQPAGKVKTIVHTIQQISGLSSSLEVKTNKNKYFSTEEIKGLGKIQNGSRDITDGTLNMEVTRLMQRRGGERYHITDFASDNDIYYVALDGNGNPVVSLFNKVIKFNGTQWECIMSRGTLSYYINDLFVDSLGRIWRARDFDYVFYCCLEVFDGSSWKKYTTADGLVGTSIYSIAEDTNGNIWFGTGYGISKFDGTTFTNYTEDNGCPLYSVGAISIDSSGAVWLGSYDGAARFDGTNWTTYTIDNSGLPENDICAIAVDKDDHVWFATMSGLTEFDGTNWRSFSSEEAGIDLSNNSQSRLTVDSDNHLWLVSSYSGLIEYDGSAWRNFGVLDGINSLSVTDVAVSRDGKVWAATDRGLSRRNSSAWSPVYVDLNKNGLIVFPEGMVVDTHNNKWFATSFGLEKFDGENWTTYLVAGNEAVGSIAALAIAPNDVLWLGSDRGLKKFDGVNWTTYPYPQELQDQAKLIASMVVDTSGRIWIDNGRPKSGLWVFDGTNWRAFYQADGLPEDSVLRVAVDKQGRIWAGTWTTGIGVYDGTNWVIYDTSNGLPDNRVTSIFTDSKGAVWAGTFNGLSRYDGQNWKIFSETDGLPAGSLIVSIAEESNGTIWTLLRLNSADYYLYRYDGSNWTLATFFIGYADQEGHYNLFVIDRKDDFWLSCWENLARYGGQLLEESTVWTTSLNVNQGAGTTVENEVVFGQISDPGNYILKGTFNSATRQKIAESSYPFQVFGPDVSMSLGTEKRYYRKGENAVIAGEVANGSGLDETDLTLKIYRKLNTEPEELIFQDSFSLAAMESRPWSFTQNEPAEGNVFLRGEVLRQQTMAFSSESGYEVVVPVIEATIDAPPFVGNEPFDLNVKLANRGKLENSVSIRIAALNFEQAVTLSPGEEKTLSVQTQLSATTEYKVEISGDIQAEIQKTVVYGYGAMVEIPAPLIYPKGLVEVPVTVRNTGSLDLALEVDYELYAATSPTLLLASLKRNYAVAAQSGTADSLPFSLEAGEYLLKYNSVLAQGQAVLGIVDPGAGKLTLQSQSVYAQGLLTLPYTLLNESSYAGDIDVSFKIKKGEEDIYSTVRSYSLKAAEARDDTVNFEIGTEGEYTFIVEGAKLAPVPPVEFKVVPLERVVPAVTFGAASGGGLPISISLANTGYSNFVGFIEARSDFYNTQQAVNVPGGQTQNIDMVLSLGGGTAGEHPVSVVLVSAAGQETPLETKPVKIETADIVISELPAGSTFIAGEQASLTFKLRNQGNLEGESVLGLKVMDALDESRKLVLSPGGEQEVTFTFTVPDNLVEQSYPAIYRLDGAGVKGVKEGDLRFNVQGISIDVAAHLDKSSYREGETANLILNVTNKNETPVEMFAKVNYGEYEGEQDFTLEQTSSLDFAIPLPEITGEKVFYGIYQRDGRGVHLNDIYVYKKGDVVEVLMDKQVYEPGSTVQIQITSTEPGLMTISAPGYEEQFVVEGATSRSFILPSDMKAGTYGLSWELAPADGSGAQSAIEFFDVAGLKVVVTEASLDKGRYAPGETIGATIVFESNRDISPTLKLWVVDPNGGNTEVASRPATLSASEQTITTESFAFTTEYAGMHSVVYGLYDAENQLLVSGSEAFDCGGAVVMGVTTDKSAYPLGTEEVKVGINLFGDGEANILLFINGDPVKTERVVLSGMTVAEVTLEPSVLRLGTVALRAEVQRDGLVSRKETSFAYGSALPDLAISSLTSSRENLIYKIRAEVQNQGHTAAGATAISFYEGDPSQGGILIEEKPIAPLDSDASTVVEIQWNGQAKSGDRTIFAVVDKANAVREFNETNNEASLEFNIPEIVHELKLDRMVFSAFEDMNMTTLAINNKEAPIEGQYLLKITNNSTGTNIQEYSGEIAPIAPMGQSLLVNVYNWGANPEGEYRITQTLTLDGKTLVDETVVTVLRTEKISASFKLDPSKISPNRDESVRVTIRLENRGNVGIENGTLALEFLKKETGQKVEEKTMNFSLAIAETKDETQLVTLNLAGGFYTVRLLYKDEVLDEKELEAKVQISYTKQESLAPRVLVLANPWSLIWDLLGNVEKRNYYKERILIEEALREAGISYKIEANPILQIRELRSGLYNVTLLQDIAPIFDQAAKEITERVWGREGVLGMLRSGFRPEFIKELFGIIVEGVVRNVMKTIQTLATPISQAGEFSLKSDFLTLRTANVNLQIAGVMKDTKKPAIALRQFNNGRAVAYGFGLTAVSGDPAYPVLKRLLLNSILYVKPGQPNGGTISRLIPIELSFQNPTSSTVELKIVEEWPQGLKLASVEPAPAIQEPLTWRFSLDASSSKSLRYVVELPDLKGAYELKTNITQVEGENEQAVDSVLLTYSVDKTILELVLESVSELQRLPVSSLEDQEAVRQAVANLNSVLNRDLTKLFAYHINLYNVLLAMTGVEKIKTADAGFIRTSLIELMLAYERKTVEVEKAMKFPLIIDLKGLLGL